MKTCAKSLVLLLATTISTLCLTACGNNSTNPVSGNTYVFESCTIDGEDATQTVTSMYKEQSFSFQDNGACVQTVVWSDEFAEAMGTSDPIEQNGTYEVEGSTVTVTFASDAEDVVMEFTIDGDTLKMDEDGSVMIYRLKSNS